MGRQPRTVASAPSRGQPVRRPPKAAFEPLERRVFLSATPAADPDDQFAEALPTAVGRAVQGNTIEFPGDVDLYRFTADADDQIAEATSLEPFGFSEGASIDFAHDVDVYSFVVAPGMTFSLHANNGGDDTTLDPYLRLFDAAGRELAASETSTPVAGHTSRFPVIRYTFDAGGTYYVAVSGSPNAGYDPVGGGGDRSGSEGPYVLSRARVAPDPDPDPDGDLTIEAEDATVVGGTVSDEVGGYSGSGFVDYLHAAGDYVEFTLTASNSP